MKSKLLSLLFVALCATVTLPARIMPLADSRPQVIIVVDYTPDTPPGRPHIFRSWCEYVRYFWRRLRPIWP